MRLVISDIFEFVHCVYDFVCDEYGIEPREFDTKILGGHRSLDERDTSLLYCFETDRMERYECRAYDKRVHVHGDVDRRRFVVCCSQPDTVALRYIVGSVFHPLRRDIIERLHEWLPSATLHCVDATMLGTEHRIDSYFEPSYAARHADADSALLLPNLLVYRYFKSHIDTSLSDDYVLQTSDKIIMVRARSPSPGAAKAPKNATKKKTKSRARSQSPLIIVLDVKKQRVGGGKAKSRRSRSPTAAAAVATKSSKKKSGKARARSPSK